MNKTMYREWRKKERWHVREEQIKQSKGWWASVIAAAKKHDPAARHTFEIVLTYPGIHALFWHRLAYFLHHHHLPLVAKIHAQFWRMVTGVEIHPAAKIAKGVFIDHGMGVVIGETAEIEADVVLYHGVTLGGTGKTSGKRHPTIRRGAMIAAHAQILGPVTIGVGAKVGAGAVVLQDVPDGATAVGIPARIIQAKK